MAVTTSERHRNPAPSLLPNPLPILVSRSAGAAAAGGNLSSPPMLLDQDLSSLPRAAQGSATAAVTTSVRPRAPPPPRLLNLLRPGLMRHGGPAGAHLPSPMLLEHTPSAPQRPRPPAAAAGSGGGAGGGGSGSGLPPAGPEALPVFTPPVLVYQLPSKATVRRLVSVRMLHRGRYGRKALDGKPGPYKEELKVFKELCTSKDRLRVNSLCTKLGFSGGVSAATFQRHEGLVIRFLGFVHSSDPGAPISLHFYIARTDLFFLFLASLLYRADGNPDELYKHLLVSKPGWLGWQGCLACLQGRAGQGCCAAWQRGSCSAGPVLVLELHSLSAVAHLTCPAPRLLPCRWLSAWRCGWL